MAVAFDAVGPSASGTTSATSPITWTHVCGASATHLLVGATWDGSPDGGGSMSATYNSVAMTSLGVWHTGGGTAGFLQVWALAAPATGSHSVSVTAGGSPGGINAGSVSFTGSAGGLSAVQSAVSSGAATNPTLAFTGSVSGNVVAAFVGGGSPQTPSGSFTSRYNENAGSGQQGAGYTACSTIASPGGSTTASWTMNADFWAVAAVELQAGTGPVQGPAPQRGGKRYRGHFGHRQTPVPALVAPPVVTVNAGVATASAAAPAAGAPRAVITGLGGTGAGFFADQGGNPRLVIGDESWGLPANAGRWTSGDWQGTYDAYLTARAAQGFTVIYNKPMGNTVTGGVSDNGNTWDGVAPFTTGQDPSSGLNATFWARIDYYLAKAAAAGLTVFFNLGQSYDEATGGLQAGWTNTQWSDFGAAMGNRYKTTPNIVWVIGDDSFGGSDDAKWDALLSGLRGTGDTHVIAPQYYPESTSRRDLASNGALSWGGSNTQWNLVYSYNVSYFGVEQAYLESSPVTVLRSDGYFYQNQGTTAEELLVRSLFWWALSSGSRGFIFGSEGIWQWPTGAAAATTAETFFATTAGAIRAAFEALPGWHLLIPDTSSLLVTAGRGTRATSLSSGGGGGSYTGSTDAYVSASRVPDGSLAVIYMSHGSTITVDQAQMVTGYTATWLDPVTGATSAATPGSTYNSTAKGSNSAGGPDWVLVLQAATPGTAPAGVAAATAAAVRPTVAVSAFAGVAAATGTALAPAHAATASAGVPASAASAPGPLAAAAVPAGVAVATAVAPGATVSVSSGTTAPAGVAAAAAVALAPSIAITASAAAAAGSATALQSLISAAAASGPATAAGTSLAAAGATAARPGAATSPATALPPAPALTVAAGAAGSLAIAPAAAVSTSGNTNVPAGVAAATGTALTPAGAGAVHAGAATAAGTAPAATGQAARLATAGAAAATGTAPAPAMALASFAHAGAAQALGAALAAAGTGDVPDIRATSAPVVTGVTSVPAVAGASPGPQVSARVTSAPSVS